MFVLQIVAIILCVAFFAYVVHLVARERLLLKYSLLWMALTVVIVLCALFPQPLYSISSFLGFETPSNFIFFIGLFFLLAISLSLSSIASKQALMIKNSPAISFWATDTPLRATISHTNGSWRTFTTKISTTLPLTPGSTAIRWKESR